MASPPANHLQQPTLRVVVVFVLPHVRREVVDPLREHGDLNLRGACVPFVPSVFQNDGSLLFLRQHYALPQVPPVVFSGGSHEV